MAVVQQLLWKTDDRGVTTLTLNHPERHNALDGHLVKALVERLEVLAEDPSVRVLVLTGIGRSFCSGVDLMWMQQVVQQGDEANRRDAREVALLMQRLNDFPRPTVAQVNGSAYGGGVGLIACCDIAVADAKALFAFTEVRLGLVAAVIAPYIVAAIGRRHARRFLLSGEQFTSNEALAMHLVHRVVATGALADAVEVQISNLLRGEQGAQTESKRLLQRLMNNDPQLLRYTADLTARVRASAAARKGIERFLQQRRRRMSSG